MSALTQVAGQQFNNTVQRIVLSGGGKEIKFDFNPESVEMSRDAKSHGPANVQASTSQMALQLSGNLILTLNRVRFIGSTVEARMDQLLEWARGTDSATPPTPGPGQTGDAALNELTNGASQLTRGTSSGGAQVMTELPELTLTWGTGEPRNVVLQRVAITIDQYTTQGDPLAATATITLVCLAPQLPNTNPSSGGIPGRSSHVLVSGENLIGLATSTYGSASLWRRLAQANNIDDPLRVPAGRQIYLPSPSEL